MPNYCPLCNSEVDEFLSGGHSNRPGVRCPTCKSNARARLAWLIFERQTDLLDGKAKAMLHIAPERALADRLTQVPGLDYLTADLDPAKAMVQMDITDIRYPDASFDAIMCSHVLEHVPEDRKGMRELRRVLKPSGWMLFMIPLKRESTFEDPSIMDPDERERQFGHPEHVRVYGEDFADRLADAGLEVRRLKASELLSETEAKRVGVQPGSSNAVFLCRRSAASGRTQ